MIVDVQNVRKNGKKWILLIYSCFTCENCVPRGFTICPYPFFRVTISRKTKSGLNIVHRGRREGHTRKEGDHLENLSLNTCVILKQTWEGTVCGGSWMCELDWWYVEGAGCVNWTDGIWRELDVWTGLMCLVADFRPCPGMLRSLSHVVGYRRLRTSYRSLRQGSGRPGNSERLILEDGADRLSRNVGN